MRALRLHELGEPTAVLRIEELADHEPRPGEIVVDAEAAALNFPDILLCRGEYQEKPTLPFTPGVEMAGVVRKIGEGVTRVKVGDDPVGGDTFDRNRKCIASEGRIQPAINDVIHDDVMALHASGRIDPVVSEVVGLGDAADALTRQGGRGTVGKIVVHPRA